MKNFRFCIILFFASILSLSITKTNAQYYTSGQDPASIQWNQINSENFQVIYPRGYDSIAQYVMNVMEYGRELSIKVYQIEPKKISIILHNQTLISNAEVAWAPRRMEFYSVTPQSTISQLWYEQLAVHEYAHVLQISSMHQGFTKFLYNLFGEQITVGIFGLYVPYWFIEGDAVVNETALSKSGRGRDPNFEAELRAQILEKGPYTLEKAALGSYEDFTTDRYHLGYYLVGQGKVKYGKDMWNKALGNVAKFPLAVVPFSQGIKTKSGLYKKKFYEKTLDELYDEWLQQLIQTKAEDFDPISDNKTYMDYTNNAFLEEHKIFALKEDYHDIGRFVYMDQTGIEEKFFTPGFYFNDYITVGGDYICWSEYHFDARWDNKNSANIMLLNTKTGKKTKLLKKTRYFSPNISPSGEKIAVVEVDEWSQHFLVILDTKDGSVLNKIGTPDNDFIAHPSWSPEEDKIVAEVMNSEGKGLAIFDLKTGNKYQILSYQQTQLQYPTFWKNYILFEAAYAGVMDIYALEIRTKSLYKTTSAPFSVGNYSVSPSGQELVISSYTANGRQVMKKEWNPKKWQPISDVKNLAYPLADMLSAQVDTSLRPDLIPTQEYEVKKYSKIGHLLNFHSWNFLNLDANNGGINPGISLLSQNLLSTMTAQLGADYNFNSKSMRYYGELNYLGWYPAISLRGDYGGRYYTEINGNDTINHYWKETNLSAAIYLPLLFTSGNWSHRIQPEASFNYQQIDAGADLNFNFTHVKSLNYSIQLGGSQKSPFQNIFPKWGYSLSFAYSETPFDTEKGNMWSAGAAIYIPGIFRHDGLRLMADYQDKLGVSSFYNDRVGPARGYSSISYKDMLSLRADYKVPLFYPDWNLGSLFYFKRFVLGLFYDYTIQPDLITAHSYENRNYFWSSGVDLTTDIHLLRSKFPFEIGIRTTYVDGFTNNSRGVYFQLLYGVSI